MPFRSNILLVAFPARYLHTPFALYSLQANLGDLAAGTEILELPLDLAPEEAAARILAHQPRIVGFSVYLWNVERVRAVAEILKVVAPSIVQVVGGPQIVPGGWGQRAGDGDRCGAACRPARLLPPVPPDPWPADYAVEGEGELVFDELCRRLLAGDRPATAWRPAPPPDPAALALPYRLYSETDIRQRVLYIETTRGCPHPCAYCTSADSGLRHFPLKPLFGELDALLRRGARRFKLLDRSFDADPRHAAAVLDAFLGRLDAFPLLNLHLEWVPAHLPESLLLRLKAFPAGALHLELGIQTLDATVAARVGRKGDPARILATVARLLRETGAELHLDLIIGLPGESLEGFGRGFDRLAALCPHALQVNPLKRLPGTPLDRQAASLGLAFDARPPYALLASDAIAFVDMLRLRRLAYVWDRVYNREPRPEARAPWIAPPSPFLRVMAFSDNLFARFGRVHGIARPKLSEAMAQFLASPA